jgi:antitoxin HicB
MNKLPEKLSYHVVFEPEPEGGYTVTVPTLSGCLTYGATFEEAVGNIREAILLCLDVMIEEGEPIPTDTQAPIISSIELSPAELHA